MGLTAATDGFRLAYERGGAGEHAVVLLHGWPGDRSDYRSVQPLLADRFDVVVPDLRGFGGSDKHVVDRATGYSAVAQARGVAALIEELGLDRPIVAGYDVGSRVAQALAGERPELVHGLVVSPPLPGVGDRVLAAQPQREFWYQSFHQLRLAQELIDGRTDAVRAYLRHFWTQWSGPEFTLEDAHLEHLVASYSTPGAFTASIGWYRAGAGTIARSLDEQAPRPEDRIAVPTAVLWPDHDPLFPREWSDRLDEFFSDVTLHPVDGVGHFTPLECPERFAALVRASDLR